MCRKSFLLWLLLLCAVTNSYSQAYNEIAKLVNSDAQNWDTFGWVIESDSTGNLLAIGAPNEDKDQSQHGMDAGAVYLFSKTSNNKWIQIQKLVPHDRQKQAYFGMSLKFVDSSLFIGAYGRNDTINGQNVLSAGGVYEFKLISNGIWQQNAIITPTSGNTYKRFGYKICYNEGQLMASDRLSSVYVFEKDSVNKWVETQRVFRPFATVFAEEFAVSGKQMLISAHNDGSVVAYEKDPQDKSWYFREIIDTNFNFGISIDIEDSLAVIGNSEIDYLYNSTNYESAGMASIYRLNASGNWIKMQDLHSNDPFEYEEFGRKVRLRNKEAFIGCFSRNNITLPLSPDKRGSVQIFKQDLNQNWAYQQKLVAWDSLTEYFGSSISFSNSLLLVGAIAGTYEKNSGGFIFPGAVYIYNQGFLEIDKHLSKTFETFPNPSSNRLMLILDEIPSTSYILTLISSSGAVVFTKQLREKTNSIDLPSLQPGIYLLNLSSDGKQIAQRKLVIE